MLKLKKRQKVTPIMQQLARQLFSCLSVGFNQSKRFLQKQKIKEERKEQNILNLLHMRLISYFNWICNILYSLFFKNKLFVNSFDLIYIFYFFKEIKNIN